MKFALIEPSGRIAEIATEAFPVHPSLRWIECPDDTTARHVWDGSAFAAPPPPPVLERPRDLAAELDALKERVGSLESRP